MTNLHAQHSKGWSGLAFVVLLIVTTVLIGIPPAANAGPFAVSGYLNAHRNGLVVSGWLTFPIGAFFLWFTVGLASYLRRNAAQDEGLPTYALVSGTFVVVGAWIGSALVTALAFIMPPGGGGLSFVWAVQSLVNGAYLSMALAIFLFASAHSMRRHTSAPAWMAWLGYLAALGQAFSSLGVLNPSGIAAGNIILALVVPFVLFLIWMVVVSTHLILAAGGKERAGAVSPA